MKKHLNLICPDCEGKRVEPTGEPCILCGGTGIFSDVDIVEEFSRRYDFSG